jgi:hypothetical protein
VLAQDNELFIIAPESAGGRPLFPNPGVLMNLTLSNLRQDACGIAAGVAAHRADRSVGEGSPSG